MFFYPEGFTVAGTVRLTTWMPSPGNRVPSGITLQVLNAVHLKKRNKVWCKRMLEEEITATIDASLYLPFSPKDY